MTRGGRAGGRMGVAQAGGAAGLKSDADVLAQAGGTTVAQAVFCA